jgi:hypothetical protein
MGYFDGLASGRFKRDESGNTVFYPWGVLGRGRLLPDEAAQRRVFRFVKLYTQISLVLVIGVGSFFGWWYAFILLPILYIWYYLQCKALVSTYPESQSKLTIKQSNTGAATGYGEPVLWALFGGSALFVAAGLWMTVSSQDFDRRAVGLLGVLFFGASAITCVYMLKLARDITRSPTP